MEMTLNPSIEDTALASPAERRRYARLSLAGELQAELVPGGPALVVLDLSENGCSVEAKQDFKQLQDYRIRFFTAKRSHGVLRVINVHCLHASMATGPVYFAGFQFAEAADAVAIRGMLREVRAIKTASRA
jgi:hypothetical protein